MSIPSALQVLTRRIPFWIKNLLNPNSIDDILDIFKGPSGLTVVIENFLKST